MEEVGHQIEIKDPRNELLILINRFIGDSLPAGMKTPYFPFSREPSSKLPENSLLLVEFFQKDDGKELFISLPALEVITRPVEGARFPFDINLRHPFNSIAVFSEPNVIYSIKYRDPDRRNELQLLSYGDIIKLTCGFKACEQFFPHLVLAASPFSLRKDFPYQEISQGDEITFREHVPNIGPVIRSAVQEGILPFYRKLQTPSGVFVVELRRYQLSDPPQLEIAKAALLSTLNKKGL